MDANTIARACADTLWADDLASRRLGIELISVEPGNAVLAMSVTDQMVDAHRICHGGHIFTVAHTAFSYASNTHNRRVVTQHCAITFLDAAELGDRVVARAAERQRAGATGIYDVLVTREEGFVIAEFRGVSRMLDGELVPGGGARRGLGLTPARQGARRKGP
jgi:acyl-CoA thioesterase